MIAAVFQVRSLLLAIFVLMAGSGVMSTLIALRLERVGSGTMVVGLVATAYFIGLVTGAIRAGRIVRSVGHIRAFAAFVALLSASTLTYSLIFHPLLWGVLRLVDGLCVAGVFICVESWLNDRAERGTRGTVLASYMVALYAGQAIGQMLLQSGGDRPATPFEIASILISLAIIPVCLTRSGAPQLGEAASMSLSYMFRASPLGVVGAWMIGIILGAFYGLAALYARRAGLNLNETAAFMTTVIAGGIALQWPLGRLSDRFDRRKVITACFLVTLATAAALAMRPDGFALFALGFAFGGLSFALYPLCVAHANDRLTTDERMAASGQLVLLYSAGAAVGPLSAATVMTLVGPGGLFLFIAICALMMLLFAIWRLFVTRPVPETEQQLFQALPRTTPLASLIDRESHNELLLTEKIETVS